MNLQQLRDLRARYFEIGNTELVEAFDAMLPFFPRDESVETDAEKQVRAALEGLGRKLTVKSVEWFAEDKVFEVEFATDTFISRYELEPQFNVIDSDVDTAWVTPKWEIVK